MDRCAKEWGWGCGVGVQNQSRPLQQEEEKASALIRYLDDFSLSVLGPEGLRWGGAADGDKAAWLSVQRGSDQLAASCTHTHTDYKLWDLMVGRSLILGPGMNVEQHFSAFMSTEGLHWKKSTATNDVTT